MGLRTDVGVEEVDEVEVLGAVTSVQTRDMHHPLQQPEVDEEVQLLEEDSIEMCHLHQEHITEEEVEEMHGNLSLLQSSIFPMT